MLLSLVIYYPSQYHHNYLNFNISNTDGDKHNMHDNDNYHEDYTDATTTKDSDDGHYYYYYCYH